MDQNEIVQTGWRYLYDTSETSVNKNAPIAVTNGTLTLNIGDYINYDPGSGEKYTSEIGIEQTSTYITNGFDWKGVVKDWAGYRASDYQKELESTENDSIKNKGNGNSEQTFSIEDMPTNTKWQVLGVDEKTGELLIFATNKVADFTLKGITGYLHSVDELNNICNIYGKGRGATKGRSLTLNEVNKITGKENNDNTEEIKFFWKTSSKDKKAPYVKKANSEGFLYYSHMINGTNIGIFNYYDEVTKKWITDEQDLENLTEDKIITTQKRDFGGYTLNDKSQINTKGYKVIFSSNNNEISSEEIYWLGTSYKGLWATGENINYASWGLDNVSVGNSIGGSDLYFSNGYVVGTQHGVRPVISLEKDIKLEKSQNAENTYDIK